MAARYTTVTLESPHADSAAQFTTATLEQMMPRDIVLPTDEPVGIPQDMLGMKEDIADLISSASARQHRASAHAKAVSRTTIDGMSIDPSEVNRHRLAHHKTDSLGELDRRAHHPNPSNGFIGRTRTPETAVSLDHFPIMSSFQERDLPQAISTMISDPASGAAGVRHELEPRLYHHGPTTPVVSPRSTGVPSGVPQQLGAIFAICSILIMAAIGAFVFNRRRAARQVLRADRSIAETGASLELQK